MISADPDEKAHANGADGVTLTSHARLLATLALMIATAMQGFDATITNVALPHIEGSFNATIDFGSWVITSYLCAATVTAPLTGWLRRRFGPKDLFITCIMLFIVSSLGCSIAGSRAMLILFRVIQGAAGGTIPPLAQAILLDIYPRRDHGRMLGLWGAAIMIGPILGPVFGGVVTDLASWRWIFTVNLPLGLAALLGLRRFHATHAPDRGAPVDGIGIVLLIVGVGALQLCLERSIGRSWRTAPDLIVEAAIAAIAAGLMLLRRRQKHGRLLRTDLFQDINFSGASFYNFVASAVLFSTIVFLPALCETLLGFSATQAGLTILPRGVTTMIAMVVVGHLIGIVDRRILLLVGMLASALALHLIAIVPINGAGMWLVSASALQGVGVGLVLTPLSTLAFSTLPPAVRTDAAGLYSLLRQLGSASGVAVMTSVLQAYTSLHLTGRSALLSSPATLAPLAAARFAAYADCFRIMALISVLIIPGILLFQAPRPTAEEAPPS